MQIQNPQKELEWLKRVMDFGVDLAAEGPLGYSRLYMLLDPKQAAVVVDELETAAERRLHLTGGKFNFEY